MSFLKIKLSNENAISFFNMIEQKISSNKIPVAAVALVIFSLMGLICYKFYRHSFVAKKQDENSPTRQVINLFPPTNNTNNAMPKYEEQSETQKLKKEKEEQNDGWVDLNPDQVPNKDWVEDEDGWEEMIMEDPTSETESSFISKATSFLFKASIEVKINPKVQSVLDDFFEGSPYKIDDLPVYSTIFSRTHYPKRKLMDAPIMKGITDDGRSMIIIKVDCTLDSNDKCLKSYVDSVKRYYRKNPKLEEILVIGQYHLNGPCPWGGRGEYLWDQLDREEAMNPRFFTCSFTFAENGSGPTTYQKAHIPAFKKLLQTGESNDLRGRTWRIPGHPALEL